MTKTHLKTTMCNLIGKTQNEVCCCSNVEAVTAAFIRSPKIVHVINVYCLPTDSTVQEERRPGVNERSYYVDDSTAAIIYDLADYL